MIYIKLQSFFFFEVYFEAPKMSRNQLNNICNGFHFFCLQFYQKYVPLQVLFKIFAQICSVVIYKVVFEIFPNFCFPENL